MKKEHRENFAIAVYGLLFLAFMLFLLWLAASVPIIPLLTLPICLLVAYITARTNILNISDKEKQSILVGCTGVALVAAVIAIGNMDTTSVFIDELFLEGKKWSKSVEKITDEGVSYYEDVYNFTPSTSTGKIIQDVLYFLFLFLTSSCVLLSFILLDKPKQKDDSDEFPSNLSIILKIILAIILTIGIFNMPYLYYKIIRWIIFLIVIELCATVIKQNNLKQFVGFVFLGTLFNPFIIVSFDKEVWQIINIILAIGLIIWSVLHFQQNKKEDLRFIKKWKEKNEVAASEIRSTSSSE